MGDDRTASPTLSRLEATSPVRTRGFNVFSGAFFVTWFALYLWDELGPPAGRIRAVVHDAPWVLAPLGFVALVFVERRHERRIREMILTPAAGKRVPRTLPGSVDDALRAGAAARRRLARQRAQVWAGLGILTMVQVVAALALMGFLLLPFDEIRSEVRRGIGVEVPAAVAWVLACAASALLVVLIRWNGRTSQRRFETTWRHLRDHVAQRGYAHLVETLRHGAPFALYLRSFSDEPLNWENQLTTGYRGDTIEVSVIRPREFDRALTVRIREVMPTYMLANVDDPTPPLGSIPLYVDPGAWRDAVSALAGFASHVVLVARSDTPGVRWELRLLTELGRIDSTLVIRSDRGPCMLDDQLSGGFRVCRERDWRDALDAFLRGDGPEE